MNERVSIWAIHLDPVGGIAGDLFTAALLDTFPELWKRLNEDLKASGVPATVSWGLEQGNTNSISAKRFVVNQHAESPSTGHYKDIVERLRQSSMSASVIAHAVGIYRLLGEAEAAIHGVLLEQVHFHEIADWDSWVDIVAAASIINQLGSVFWSVGALPIGGGRVQTAHGLLPVPAPAAAFLLKGFQFFNDGVMGERVTPTGAAILRYLIQDPQSKLPSGHLLINTGHGMGQRTLEGIPNVLRVLVMGGEISEHEDTVTEIAFEVDDMTPEEVGVTMDHMNASVEVLDAAYYPRFGKKGRVQFAIRILVKPSALQHVVAMCFQETSTIGLRWQTVCRHLLERHSVQVDADAVKIGVKIVQRGQGVSAKAESSDIAGEQGLYRRRKLRLAAEQEAENGAE